MYQQYRYKAWANRELLAQVAKIDQAAYPTQYHQAIRLLNHTLVVDRIFIAHLQGEAHGFAATNTPETPSHAALSSAMAESDAWLLDYVQAYEAQGGERAVSFTFTDGAHGRLSVQEILDHLIIHGAYHRGNVGMLLTACGLDRPADTFTRFLHEQEPERRRGH